MSSALRGTVRECQRALDQEELLLLQPGHGGFHRQYTQKKEQGGEDLKESEGGCSKKAKNYCG